MRTLEEQYSWTPSNFAEVIVFSNHILSLSDRSIALTFTDDPIIYEPAQPDAPGLTVVSRSQFNRCFCGS